MARPNLYRSESDRQSAVRQTADVINEIKLKSGLTYRELSERLAAHHVIISEAMLRQHVSGNKIMGARRLSQVALAAYDEGWSGDRCFKVLMLHDYFQHRELSLLHQDVERYRLNLERRLFLCVKELYEVGVSISQIQALVDKDCEKVAAELATR
jgi:hypothetical protein